MLELQAICYVDFSGDLRTTLCGVGLGVGEFEADKRFTLYMSSATCSACIEAIQARLGQLGGRSTSYVDSARSSSART